MVLHRQLTDLQGYPASICSQGERKWVFSAFIPREYFRGQLREHCGALRLLGLPSCTERPITQVPQPGLGSSQAPTAIDSDTGVGDFPWAGPNSAMESPGPTGVGPAPATTLVYPQGKQLGPPRGRPWSPQPCCGQGCSMWYLTSGQGGRREGTGQRPTGSKATWEGQARPLAGGLDSQTLYPLGFPLFLK